MKQLEEKFSKLHIAVIGDIMIDRYFYCEVNRISPEAPVPVAKVVSTKTVLGGASNVAANLSGLGCTVYIGGVSGDDTNRKLVINLLDEKKINYSGLISSSTRKTITKARVIGGVQQLLRMDFEEIRDLTNFEIAAMKQWFSLLVRKKLDGVIISDYAKGVCSQDFCKWVIGTAISYDIPILVDPKGNDWDKYSGCTYITPNLKEICEVLDMKCPNEDDFVIAMARKLKKRYDIKNVVVTRSEKGITVVNDKGAFSNPAVAQEVFDVSGAGDTVAATFLASVASGMNLKDSMLLANKAAGFVVEKVGTYPITIEELEW